MLKCGVDVVVKWMVKICKVAWKGGVPADWTKAIIVLAYKGKGRRGVCWSYRGISLLSIFFFFFFTVKEAAKGQTKKKKKKARYMLLLYSAQVAKKRGQFREERCPDTLLLKEFKS